MGNREIHQCECRECQEGNEAIGKQHENLNLLMSRLDEQQRRWMAALEAKKIGHGGTKKLSAITGLDINTIRRGREELFINAGHPIISVDTKKKELIGNFKNAGQTWKQQPDLVNDHEFPTDAIAKAVPYGIYDLVHNHGCVYVGTSHDTAAFAVAAIVRCSLAQRPSQVRR
jgi:Rhodopirellula transposase DDE domain